MVLSPTDSADFSYDAPRDAAGLPARVAIFAARSAMRSEIMADMHGAGFRAYDGGAVEELLAGPIALLGDVVMVDCPVIGASTLAALNRLDMRIARSGAQLIVSTSLDALDDVFAAIDQSQAQILVEPSRADRIVAVGRVLASVTKSRVREMTEQDRLNLLHLSQQVESIAHQLEGLSGGDQDASAIAREALRPQSRNDAQLGLSQDARPARLYNAARPPLPDPRLVRQLIAKRQARAKFFDGQLFADPAWDMLLDLTAAHAEHSRVSVTSLCIAAGVPATTALRWLKQMVDSGLFVRIADSTDKRRAFIALSDNSVEAMSRYFAEVENPLAQAA